MSAYHDYKDTGAMWLNSAPAHWDVKRLKFAVTLVKEKAEYVELDLPYMGLENIESWTGRYLPVENPNAEGLVNLFQEGDVLLGKLRPYLAKVHLAAFAGAASTEALVLRANTEILPEYLRYYLVAPECIENINSSSFGSKMPRANWEFIGDQAQLVPPLDEQRAIAGFLDEKTAEIDALIEKKRKLLELLAEKRAAIITNAVTKGLNPDAPMKDSGIDWLGEVPEHWTILPLRRALKDIEQGWSPACEERQKIGDEWGVLKSGCVNGGFYREAAHKALPAALDPKPHLEVRSGDVLMCRASGSPHLIGSVAKVKQTQPRLMFSDKTYRLHFDENMMLSDFFVQSMLARHMRDQIILSISGAEGLANNIPQASVKGYLACFPPIQEQRAIVEAIDAESSVIEKTRGLVEQAISILNEYRSALITSAVTGKIKVV